MSHRPLWIAACIVALSWAHASTAIAGAELPEVTAQGLMRSAEDLGELRSPSGLLTGTAIPRSTQESVILWDILVRSSSGREHRFESIPGTSFFLSDRPCVLALARPEVNSIPAHLRIYGLDGRLLHERRVPAPSNPTLSPDGMFFACGVPSGTMLLDLRDFSERSGPHMDLLALGAGGLLVGVDLEARVVRVVGATGRERTIPCAGSVRRIALDEDRSVAFLLERGALRAVDLATGRVRTVSTSDRATEYRDLRVMEGRILVGTRVVDGERTTGGITILDSSGREIDRRGGPSMRTPKAVGAQAGRGIPWPIAPDEQHPVGNTYGEYQYYGGAPYPHPGFDVMGEPGQAVFAVRRGVVKAILTTSGSWHWRVAVGDSTTASTSLGYLYAHLDQPTIAVDVGDIIEQGEYLGDLVEWPIYGFTHCHFTRIEDSGATWDGVWLSVHNPHLDLTEQSETEPPVFEPARGSDLLAFCNNETSTYQSPSGLHGAVDIIAHVGDRIASSWVCTVQELRYTIYPLGMPEHPLVDDRLSQYFDFVCDTYGSGEIDAFMIDLLYKDDSVCNTQGDYDYREFFHVVTNTDGDGIIEETDPAEAWDTSSLPDRSYVVKVTAIDVAGNARSDSMIVTTLNGNPSGLADGMLSEPRLLLESIAPNPALAGTSIRFRLASADRISAIVHDPAGRRVRVLPGGAFSPGAHSISWDGNDGNGLRAASGTYFVVLQGSRSGSRIGRIQLVR